MHTRASNSELVEPLPEPERTLNRRLFRQNKRVPFDQRNNPSQHLRIVYPPILNINYFRHFLDILRNYDPMDDEPMWAADHVVAPTLSYAITIPETGNKFPLKLISFSKIKSYSSANQKTQSSLKKIVALADEGNSNSDTDKIMAQMDAMTIKMDAQYKELQSHAKQPTPDLEDDDIPMSREEEAKFMQTFSKNMLVEVDKFTFPADFVILEMEEDNKVPLILGQPFLHTADAVIQVKQKQLNLGVGTERIIFNIDSAIKHSYSNDDTCFSIDVIDEILEEDFDALLDEGSKILHSIEGTVLEEEIFFEFDKFIAMTADENYDSESDIE
ncbi:reverse transcriptase domain-containing protein [Tanacetum coccineum]